MNEKNIKVIMAGSGALYPLYVGSLLALKEENYNIVSIAGTSGGGIAAAVWSLSNVNKNKEDLLSLIEQTLPNNNKNLIKYSLANFFTKWGLIDGANVEKQFEEIFKPTLKEATIPTYIYAATVNRHQEAIFSSVNNPEYSTAKVVRASCSIPFIFNPTRIDNELYVDGGWSNHIPIDTFSKEDIPGTVLGMRISSANEPYVSSNLVDYIQSVMYGKIIANHQYEITPKDYNIIDYKSKYNRMKLANTTSEEAREIFNEGYEQTKEFLKKR